MSGSEGESHRAPLVPISHATEDKDRFVVPFAERLRANGIDAWLDQWEIGPGDSLVDKINKAIDSADAFIAVLSAISVTKPWVRAELNAATIARIERSCRLVPVVLDGATVPALLRDTLQIRIPDANHYDEQFDLLVRRLHGQGPAKLSLGLAPAWTVPSSAVIGVGAQDVVVLDAICRGAVAQGTILWSDPSKVLEHCVAHDLSDAAVFESLDELAHGHLIEFDAFDRGDGSFQLMKVQPTKYGFRQWLEAACPDFADVRRQAIAELASDRRDRDLTDLVLAVGNPPVVVVEAVLDELKVAGYIKLVVTFGYTGIFGISSRISRLVD